MTAPPPPERRGPVPPQAVVPPRTRNPAANLAPEHLYKAVGLLFLFLLLHRFFTEIARVFLIIYAAAILAVAFNVVVRALALERRWVSAAMGIFILGAIGVLFWFGIPALAGQVQGLTERLPEFEREAQRWSDWLRERTGLNIGLVSERSEEFFSNLFGGMGGPDVLGQALGLLEMLFLPIVILFGALYAVAKPNERLLSPVLRAVPRDRRLAFRRLFELLGERLRGWVKGTLIAMLAVGVLSTTAFYLIGLDYALILGLLMGLLEFVPLVGPWVGGAIATAIAFLDDPTKALWVILAMLAIQQLESNLITPVVMSQAAEVHPFVTLFALFFFGTLFGFFGILLAVPLVLLVWTVVEVLWVERAIDTDEDRIEPVVEE